MSEAHILVASRDNVAAIRVIGRATFKVSRDLRAFCLKHLKKGVRSIIVDLSECQTMDSTFMGVLAMAGLQGRDRVQLLIVNASQTHRDLLDGIGVSKVWTYADTPVEDVNWTTLCKAAAGVTAMGDVAPTMLAAHETLMHLDPANIPKFKDVVDMLSAEIGTDSNDA